MRKILSIFSVPNLCDAGARVLKGIKPVNPMQKMIVGETVTVKTSPNDWGTVVKAIKYARNKIIVVDANGGDIAVWGGLASTNAKLKGVLGVVVDGGIRDIEDINTLKFPAFARYVVPNAGKPLDEGEINVPITCGGEVINPKDIVVGDCNGVAVIKREELNEVIENVKAIKEKETNIKNKILRGMDIGDILGLK
ncbi:RraA family protein [Methanotorris formicicus]|uniref:Dimethylmenaquinone methyltransferase n=1 Tax=Methanotorris formicicus Mc-S-70 TaxID=647171 RepID=H1KYJ4_9EURY|nr:hypothetical protein [Methanotorris formicicus]EHP87034.1 Dimethylmenaquinone methyltransferase [Methanotorris formicicus Mc-S-70]